MACARAVAIAIRNSKKFNAEEHKAVLNAFSALRKQHPEWDEEINERTVVVGNRSAFTKDMAKAGIVSEGEPSAWVREIAEMVDTVETELVKAIEETGKSKKP
jgi:hypothetical protein